MYQIKKLPNQRKKNMVDFKLLCLGRYLKKRKIRGMYYKTLLTRNLLEIARFRSKLVSSGLEKHLLEQTKHNRLLQSSSTTTL